MPRHTYNYIRYSDPLTLPQRKRILEAEPHKMPPHLSFKFCYSKRRQAHDAQEAEDSVLLGVLRQAERHSGSCGNPLGAASTVRTLQVHSQYLPQCEEESKIPRYSTELAVLHLQFNLPAKFIRSSVLATNVRSNTSRVAGTSHFS